MRDENLGTLVRNSRAAGRWLLFLTSLFVWGCAADRGVKDDEGQAQDMMAPSDRVIAPPVFGPGADPSSPGQFDGGEGGAAPQVVYPFDGVMLASNINQMRLAFRADASHNHFRITLDSARYSQTIYLGTAACDGAEHNHRSGRRQPCGAGLQPGERSCLSGAQKLPDPSGFPCRTDVSAVPLPTVSGSVDS